jgi:hypothetical protein
MAGVKIALDQSLFATPLEPPEKVRLRGSKCNHCGVAFLGKLVACENCQSTNITEYQLPRYGKLYSYTVQENLRSMKAIEEPRGPGDGEDDLYLKRRIIT